MTVAERTARKHIKILNDLKCRIPGDREWGSAIGVAQYVIAREHNLNTESWALWEAIVPTNIKKLREAFCGGSNPHSKPGARKRTATSRRTKSNAQRKEGDTA